MSRSLVLVTGAGRSGTSTVTGVLHHLGYYVPQPVLGANRSNPKGFFESTWPLWFHRRLMDAADIEQIDGRPEARDLIAAAVTDDVRAELRTWLADQLAGQDRVVVKDPRSAWVPGLWDEVGTSCGAAVRYLTMLRHPAEIVGSRATYYGEKNEFGLEPRPFAIVNLCGWININLVAEQRTRELPRVWIRYQDLLADWRSAFTRVRDGLGLDLDDDLVADHEHPVDSFIDPGLRRHEPAWADDLIPLSLQAIAEDVWRAGSAIALSGEGRDAEAEALLDDCRRRYDALYADSVAIARDETAARVRVARRRAARRARRELRERLEAERAAAALPRRAAASARRRVRDAVRGLRGHRHEP